MSLLKKWCDKHPDALKAFNLLFAPQPPDFRNLEKIFAVCEEAWKRNLIRLKGKRIRYLLVAEAAPWTEPDDTPSYFYDSLRGRWCNRILTAFNLTPPEGENEIENRLSVLAEKGFVLVDSLPFAASYTTHLRQNPAYLELVRHCRPYVESRLADLSWDGQVKVALAFKWNGLRVIESYNSQLLLPNGTRLNISENLVAADGSGFTNADTLKALFSLPRNGA